MLTLRLTGALDAPQLRKMALAVILCVAMLPGCVGVRGTTGHTVPQLHVTGQVVDESGLPLAGMALTYAAPRSVLVVRRQGWPSGGTRGLRK